MNEFTCLSKKLTIAAAGIETIGLETGYPYRNYTAWVSIPTLGILNVSVQPMFGGFTDGAATTFTAAGVKKAKQATTDELRPSTRGYQSTDGVLPLKSEIVITNSGGSPIEANIYLLASQG